MKKLIGTLLIAFAFTLVPLVQNASALEKSNTQLLSGSRKSVQTASAKRHHAKRHHKGKSRRSTAA
jgi:hypothetical protein